MFHITTTEIPQEADIIKYKFSAKKYATVPPHFLTVPH